MGRIRRKIDGHYFYPSGYEGRAAKVKRKYYQENGFRVRIFKIGGKDVLYIGSQRKRRRKK